MPQEVIVRAVPLTDSEKETAFRFAAETECPNCGLAARCVETTRHKARKGAVASLQRRCRCPLPKRFYAREYPQGVTLLGTAHDGEEYRLTLIGGVLHTPQFVPLAAAEMVGTVRAVPDDPTLDDDAADAARMLSGKGYKATAGGREFRPPAKKPRAKKKKAVAR